MGHALVVAAVLCVYATRDSQVLAYTRLPVLRISFLIYASTLSIALFLVSANTAHLDSWQYWHLLRGPAVWVPCIVYHLTAWLLHRRSVRSGAYRVAYALDALPTPILILSLGALVHGLGREGPGGEDTFAIAGLWIGTVAVLTLILRTRPFVEESLSFAWELSENSNVFALLLVPFERFF